MNRKAGIYIPVEACDDWCESVSREITELKDRLNPLGQRRYKLSLFIRMTRRIADFSTDCEECQVLKSQITEVSEELRYSPQMTPKEYGNYLTTIKSINRHLKRKHRLVDEKQYIKRFVSISAALGLSLVMSGFVLINFGITLLALSVTLPALVIRVICSYAVGYLLDNRARKQGRVI
ncbi:hypothetical protein ACFLV1_01865 [Chloroflexota bacterium]